MAGFYTGPFSFGKKDFLLMNADQTGWWSSGLGGAILGGHEDDIAYHILHTLDGGFLLTGTTRSIGPGTTHIYLVRTDSMGHSGAHLTHQTGISEASGIRNQKGYSCFPNPANDLLYILADPTNAFANQKVTIRDISARVLMEETLHVMDNAATPINIQRLSPGNYFLEIGHETIRFIKR
jgi:hypothetical protein